MKFLAILVCLGMAILTSTLSNAQLTGNKSIPGDYTDIASAIADLNSQGVGNGGVIFNVAAGYIDTASNLVISIANNQPNSGNPITFQKSGSGNNPLIVAAPGTSAFADGIIKLSGTDYITFDRIDLLDPNMADGDQRMEWGYALLRASATDGTQHAVIKNCTVTMQKTYTVSVGIVILNRDVDGNIIVAADTTGQNSHNKIFGNSISNVYRGILVQSPQTTRDIGNEIGVVGENANTITNWGGSTVNAEGIRAEGQIRMKIFNNIINGGNGTSGSVSGIITTVFGTAANSTNYEVSHNQVTVLSTGATTNATYGIRTNAVGDSVLIHNNIVENCIASQSTASFFALTHDVAASSNYVSIHNNTVRNNLSSGTGSNVSVYGLGTYGKLIIRNNQIYGNQKSGASGSLVCIWASNSNIICDSNLVHDNSTPNSSGASATAVYGYLNNNNPPTEQINNNSFYNLSIGGSNTSASMLAVVIRSNAAASTVKDINDNLIHGISCVSGNTTTGGAYGIYSTNANYAKIYRNKIYDITNNGTNGTAGGCWVSSGTTIDIYNNFISDIKAPNSGNSNAVFGINSTSTTTNSSLNIYYNSVHLNAAGGSTFGSSALSVTANATATTASLDLRNNILINLSSPGNTGGETVGYRRSAANLQNFSNGSNHNLIYCGAPASNVLIFSDGTNTDQTIDQYKSRVSPRETNARSVNVNFTNTSAGDLHLTGASIGDVNLIGQPVSGITTDYDIAARSATYPYKGADESSAFTIAMLNLTVNLEACSPMQDTVRIQLRDANSPYAVIDSATGYLSPTGTVSANFPKALDGVNYYIVVKHRNSVETWSKSGGESFASGVLNYDFTTAASQAFGSNMTLVSGKYSFYTGDVNQDGIVDAADASLIDNDAFGFVSGYVNTDLNCDNTVDGTDALFASNNAFNFVGIVRP